MKKLVSLLIATVIGTCTVTYFTCFHHSNDTKAYAYEYYYNETNTQGEISLSSMEHDDSILFANKEFRKQFSDTFVEMAEKNFDSDRVNRVIDELCIEYADGTVLSNKRYVMRYYNEDLYEEEVNIIRDFYNRRQEYILKYLEEVLKQYN